MRSINLLFIVLWLIGSEAFAQSSDHDPTEIARGIESILAKARLGNPVSGILVVDVTNGEELYSQHADMSFIPASNQKIFTSAAAIDLLGPNYKYITRLYTDGKISSGELQGNLIVRGSGDPVIGGRFTEGDITWTFRNWADSLKAAGIRRISGDIIGDDDIFDDVALGEGWNWDDEPYWYSAEISGLSFNDNCVDVTIAPRRRGQRAIVSWEPENTSYVSIINETLTVSRRIRFREGYDRIRGTNQIRLFSRIPVGRIDKESLTVSNPTRFFVHVLKEVLEQEGIEVHGFPIDVDVITNKPNYNNLRRLATHESPPLSDIVTALNKKSHNLYAEQLLKTISTLFVDKSREGSAASGLKVIREWMERSGIDTDDNQFADGSGLSRLNLTTPQTLVDVLTYMWRHHDPKIASTFYTSLPIGGKDGSLDDRFKTGLASGNVRAKTGSVKHVSALSGYVSGESGSTLAFAIVFNNFTSSISRVRYVQDQIVELLAHF